MAVAKFECPQCQSVLKPSKPLAPGKMIACPKCGTRFAVPGGEEAAIVSTELIEDDDEEIPEAKVTKKSPPKAAPPSKAAPPPSAKKAADDDEELGGTYGMAKEEEEVEYDKKGRAKKKKKPEIDYAPDLTVKDPRGPAVLALAFPSNVMIAGAAFNFLISLLTLLVMWWPVFFTKYGSFSTPGEVRVEYDRKNPPPSQQPQQQKKAEDDDKPVPEVKLEDLKEGEMAIWDEWQDIEWFARWIVTGVCLSALVFWALTAYGGVQMQNLESRGWAMTSAILVIVGIGYTALGAIFGGAVPCIGCAVLPLGGLLCLMQLISGIFSLVKLNDEKIKEAFVYKPE